MNKEKYYNKMAVWVSERVYLKTPWFNSKGQIDHMNDMRLWNFITKNMIDNDRDQVEIYDKTEKILYKKYSAVMK